MACLISIIVIKLSCVLSSTCICAVAEWFDAPYSLSGSVSPVNIWYDLKQIATEFFSAEMHSGEVSLKHTKNPLRHLWGKQVKSAIKVTFSH